MTVSITSNRRGSYRRHHSVDDSEAALAELESELHENISSDQVGVSRTQPPRKLKRGRNGKPSSTSSEISEADSDALADLEHELEQSFGIGSSQTQKSEAPGKMVTRINRKHDRKRPSTGIVSRKSTPAVVPKVNLARATNTRLSAKRPRSDSVASSLSIADSWTVSSIADGDGLAALQAELDATPTLPGRQQSTSISCLLTDQASSFKVRNSTVHDPAAKAKVKQVAQQIAVRASGRSKGSVQPEKCGEPSTEQRVKGKPRALSVLSDSSESKGQAQAEIGLTAEPITSARTSIAAEPRRSTRLIAAASETGSDTVDELERELNASAVALNAVAPSSSLASVKTAPRKRGTIPSKRAAERTCTRISAKKLQRHEVATSFDDDQPSSAQTSTDSKGTQRVSPIVRQGSSRISSVMSDTESDELADLVAELDTIATVRTSATRPRQKRDAPANRVNTRSTSRKKSPASSDEGVSRSGTVRSVVPSPVVTLPDPVSPLRRSSCLSSVAASETESDDVEGSIPDAASTLRRSARLSSLAASDTESDDVEELIAELERGPAVNHAANTEKPKARVRVTRKQSSRVQGVKPKQSRAKKEPKTVRAPRVTRQAAPRKLVAPLSAREPPAAPRNVPSSRRSTRSSSVAFDSGSDDLADLETELQAAYTQR
uniref:Uncharacterized protein n=1 Tax=Hyaloperonospora arabidopsidis (strain Emoy2) TaxID=559515 RepID=M4BDT2_HYAAE